MIKYAVVQVAGRQYQVVPDKPFLVNFLGDVTEVECPVLMLSDDKKIEVGTPFLKDQLKLKVVEAVRGKKIRVATYHAKANTRKVVGSRATYSKLVLEGKS